MSNHEFLAVTFKYLADIVKRIDGDEEMSGHAVRMRTAELLQDFIRDFENGRNWGWLQPGLKETETKLLAALEEHIFTYTRYID